MSGKQQQQTFWPINVPRKKPANFRLTLLRLSELKQQFEMRLPDDPFTYEKLKAMVALVAGPGHV